MGRKKKKKKKYKKMGQWFSEQVWIPLRLDNISDTLKNDMIPCDLLAIDECVLDPRSGIVPQFVRIQLDHTPFGIRIESGPRRMTTHKPEVATLDNYYDVLVMKRHNILCNECMASIIEFIKQLPLVDNTRYQGLTVPTTELRVTRSTIPNPTVFWRVFVGSNVYEAYGYHSFLQNIDAFHCHSQFSKK